VFYHHLLCITFAVVTDGGSGVPSNVGSGVLSSFVVSVVSDIGSGVPSVVVSDVGSGVPSDVGSGVLSIFVVSDVGSGVPVIKSLVLLMMVTHSLQLSALPAENINSPGLLNVLIEKHESFCFEYVNRNSMSFMDIWFNSSKLSQPWFSTLLVDFNLERNILRLPLGNLKTGVS